MRPVPLPHPVSDAFLRQESACLALGSPLTAGICGSVARQGIPAGPVHDRLSNWPGDIAHGGDALPLRLTGALHYLVLSGRDADLALAYPPNEHSEDGIAPAISGAISRHGDFVVRYLDSPPQTNETGRSAILLPAFLHLHERHGLPLMLSELGASAGLNQNWHRFRYDYGGTIWGDPGSPVTIACEWRGGTMPKMADIDIAESAGCDIAPIPIGTEEDRLRLKSYVWPDQPARLQRLEGALSVAANYPPNIAKAGAADWLAVRLQPVHGGRLHILFHTIMWQYIPADEKARAVELIEDAGRRATPDAPFAWLRFEADEIQGSAGLTVTTWDGTAESGITTQLARGDFHGRWIDWRAEG